MSILLGPLSDTMSRVSWRICALAGDHTAGAAGNALPAATAVTDLRKSRRFIAVSRPLKFRVCPCSAKVVPAPPRCAGTGAKRWIYGIFGGVRGDRTRRCECACLRSGEACARNRHTLSRLSRMARLDQRTPLAGRVRTRRKETYEH